MVVAVALATIVGGQRYLYCRGMEQIMTGAACACATPDTRGQEGAALGALNDCLEIRVLGRLLASAAAGHPAVPAAAWVAVLPAAPSELPRSSAPVVGVDHPIRAGPFSPSAVRAQLMVFLT
jgi:hypothetical protein